MKKRQGFVSNSSTSSFVIIGYEFKNTSSGDIIKKFFPTKYEEIIKEAAERDYEPRDLLYDYLYKIKWGNNISVLSDGYSGSIYIGNVIADENNGRLPNKAFSEKELLGLIKNIQDQLSMSDAPSLIIGTRGC